MEDDTNNEVKTFDTFIADVLNQIDQGYRAEFESILENTMQRERAFAVVLAAARDRMQAEAQVDFEDAEWFTTQFRHLSNLSVLSQLIDVCGLGVYKDAIIRERIRALYAPRDKNEK